MSTRRKYRVEITTPSAGGFDVIWRQNGKVRGAVPVKTRAVADAIHEAIDRGVPPVDAVARALRPKRKPKIGETAEVSAKYGRLGAASRNKTLTPERRQEIARQAAVSRWGAGKATPAKDAHVAPDDHELYGSAAAQVQRDRAAEDVPAVENAPIGRFRAAR